MNPTPGVGRPARCNEGAKREPDRAKRQATVGPTLIKEKSMAYEITVGLEVVDQELYAQYRKEMRPLLDEAGGRFRYDFDVARVIHGESGAQINRAFVLQFPDQSSKERFFADPRYLEIRRRRFEPAVKTTVIIAEHLTDGAAPGSSPKT